MKDETDYIIYYLGESYRTEEVYAETGLMMWKCAWFYCIKVCDKALLMLMSSTERKES